jgi:uncharacterized glyoxalase superfamily protein PhnB
MAKSAKKKPAKKPAAKKPAKKAAKKKVAPVPAGYGTVTPHVIVSPAKDALEFYKKAFGAKAGLTMPGPNGVIMHAELKIGDSIVMFSDEMPMPGAPNTRKTPKNAGATTGGLMMYVKDVDAVYKKAVDAGCTPVMPPADQFWGDRYGQVEDPFGHVWAMASKIAHLTPKQMQAAMAAMGPPPGAPPAA